MITTEKIQTFDSNPIILDAGIQSLLNMTNDVMMKIKTQSQEIYQ